MFCLVGINLTSFLTMTSYSNFNKIDVLVISGIFGSGDYCTKMRPQSCGLCKLSPVLEGHSLFWRHIVDVNIHDKVWNIF